MALSFPVTLDGSTPFLDVQGNPITWSGDRYILSAAFYGPNDQTFLPEVRLSSTDWTITRLELAAAPGQDLNATVTELDGGAGRYIGHLGVASGNSTITLATTSVGTIEGGAGGTHSVTLGAAGADQVLLEGTSNSVYTGDGAVRFLRTAEGNDLIQIGAGGAQVVQSGGGNDTVSVWAGNVDYLDSGSGDDIVSLNYQSSVISYFDAGGDDSLTLNNLAFIAAATLANGTDTVTLNDDARIDYLRVLDATVNVTLNTDAWIGSYYAFGSTTTLNVGVNGIGQVLLEGPGTGVQGLFADGFVGSLQVSDDQTASVSLGLGGAGSVRLSGGDDTVAATGSWVEFLATGDGADRIDLLTSTVRSLDSGFGDDRIGLAGSVIQSLRDFGGTDLFTLTANSEIQQAEVIGDAKTFVLEDDARIVDLLAYDTELNVTTDEGALGSVLAYGGNVVLNIGTGGLDQAQINGTGTEAFNLSAAGFVGSVVVTGAQQATLELGAGGAGQLRLTEGNDAVITAGGLVETIATRGGNDEVFLGTGGAETVRLGAGNDVLGIADRPGDQVLVARGGAGIDTLIFDALSGGIVFDLGLDGLQNPAAAGGALDKDGLGLLIEYGFENVTGTAFNDRITGDGGANHLRGLGGDDRLIGLAGADTLDGGDGADVLLGGGGGDHLIGGAQADLIKGQAGNDHLDGGSGADRLIGGGGADLLAGGNGNDTLTGNKGADVFFFTDNGGRDSITDFQQGLDLIRIEGHSGGFSGLRFADKGDALRVTYDGGVIFLEGMAGEDLGLADFDFV